MQISLLTPVEEQLMLLLWKLDSFYMKDVLEQHPEPKPHQNTISTYLKILVEKQFLSASKEGRIFRYQTIIPSAEYRKFLLDGLIENYFNGSSDELIAVLSPKRKQTVTEEITCETQPEITKPAETTEKNPIAEYIEELTEGKKSKSKNKDKKKKKKKK